MDKNVEYTGEIDYWVNLEFDKPSDKYTNEELAIVHAISFWAKWAAICSHDDNGETTSYWSEIFEKANAELLARLKVIVFSKKALEYMGKPLQEAS